MKRRTRPIDKLRHVSHLGPFGPAIGLHPVDALHFIPGLREMGYGHLIAKKAVEPPKGD